MSTGLSAIDEQYVDVDFWSASIEAGRALGVSEPRDLSKEPLGSEIPLFGDVDEVIPMEQWDDIMDRKDAEKSWLSDLIVLVHDQDGEGSCVAESKTAQWEIKCVETLGPDQFIPLSAASLYRRTGSSPGSGSTLSANLREMRSKGALPLDTADNRARFKHVHRAVGYRTPLPEDWEETGALFKEDEYVDLEDVESLGSAILTNKPVTYARSSHCITAVKMIGRRRTNNLRFGYLNSWGQWGTRLNDRFSYGMGIDSFSTVNRVASGATALRSIGISQELVRLIQLVNQSRNA